MLSSDEVAAVLGISRRSVARRIADGSLRAVKIGGAVRVPEGALEELGFTAGDIQRALPRIGTVRGEAPPEGVADGSQGIFARYDAEAALAALRSLRGTLAGVDTERLKRDIRAEGGEHGHGRRE